MPGQKSLHWLSAVRTLKEQENILDYIPEGRYAACRTPPVQETPKKQSALLVLQVELGCGDFVKIEIMRDTKYLLPDNARNH